MKTLVSNQTDQMKIDINLLYPSPLNSFDVEDISDLVNSIKTCGLLTPLTVIGPNEDGRYEILSGERRYRSISQINKEIPGFMTEVPCYLIGASNMGDVRKKLAIELSNLEARDDYNRDTHRLQVIKLYKQLADDGEIEEKEIVRLVGESMKLSKRYSGMYLTIFRSGIPELQKAVESTEKAKGTSEEPVHIPVSVASRVAKLDGDQQREVIGRVNQGENAVSALNDIIARKNKQTADESTAHPDIPEHSTESSISNIGLGWDDIENESDLGETFYDDESINEDEEAGCNDDFVASYPRKAPTETDYGIMDEDVEERELSSYPNMDESDDSYSPAGGNASSGDEEVRRAAEMHEELDIANFDVLGFMQRNHKHVDLTTDTTGELTKYNSSEKDSATDKEVRRVVLGWINRITKKLDRNDSLDEEDMELLDRMAVLVERSQ